MSAVSSRLALFATAILGGLGYSAQAHAVIHLSLLGVGYVPEPSITSLGAAYATSGAFKIGFGAMLGLDVLPITELEFGALYYTRDMTATGKAFSQGYSEPILEIPADLRFHLGMFYLRGGLYADVTAGQVNYSLNDGSSTTSYAESVSAAKLTPWDYGALVGGGVDLSITPGMALTMGLQYQVQLSNSASDTASDPTASTKVGGLLFMAGLRLGF